MKQCQFGLVDDEVVERNKVDKIKADFLAGKKLKQEEWMIELLTAWEKQNADK